jgi:hypothetical protein
MSSFLYYLFNISNFNDLKFYISVNYVKKRYSESVIYVTIDIGIK